jgi:flagellar hook assembly protein FlgD
MLYPNYPNPFNPTTEIRYNLPVDSNVEITVYDIEGREVKTLINSLQTAGYNRVTWNSTNNHGGTVASGVYFYRMTAEEFVDMKKMIIIK